MAIIQFIKIENFRNITSLEADFSDVTVISGKNKTGKSTVRDAILWTFYDKLADGSAANNIRPKDEAGKDIDFLEIKVEVGIEHDGHSYTLTKTQKQKWTKKRGSENKVFEGNANEYEINGIPKKLKDYQEFISDIADPDTMLFGTNAQAFLSMDTKKRRAKLLSLEPDFTDADVISLDEDFKEIENDLMIGTIDELIAQAKKIKKQKNEELKSIPVRIDEVSKQKVDVDTKALSDEKAKVEAELASIQKKYEELSVKATEKSTLESQIMEIKFEQAQIEKQYNSVTNEKRRLLLKKIDNAKADLYTQNSEIKIVEARREADIALLENIDEQGKAINNEYLQSGKQKFDDNLTVCPTCGQKLPEKKISEIKAEFDSNKINIMNEIRERANNLKLQKQAAEGRIEKATKEIVEKSKSINILEQQIAKMENEAESLPADVEAKDIPEWQEKQAEIDARIDVMNQKMPYDVEDLKRQESVVRMQISSVDRQLSQAERNKDADLRIEELKSEQREVAQTVADAERRIDILERFNKAKIELLTDKVNQHFGMVKWQMFEPQINGGYQMVCNPTVGGISYFGGLNHGDRLLADMDICKAWQDASGVKLPIFLDDAESVDADRIPEYDRQLIVLRRTDDDKLIIK